MSDISQEIAVIQSAARGNDVRTSIVGALNKLNSDTLPDVSSSDVGKLLIVNNSGEWEAGTPGGFIPTPTETINIDSNGTYDVTHKASAVVSVSGGGSVLVPKTITQNGTYDPEDDNADGYSEVTVNVKGGGGDEAVKYDFTKFQGTVFNTVYDSDGAHFNSNGNSYINMACNWSSGLTFEIDVSQLQLTSGTHRRFFMATMESGFIYRNNGKWSLYGSSWATDSNITDGSFFDGSIVSVYIDGSKYWHIYKDGVLVYEPNVTARSNNGFYYIGSNSTSILNAIIKSAKMYQGLHLPT